MLLYVDAWVNTGLEPKSNLLKKLRNKKFCPGSEAANCDPDRIRTCDPQLRRLLLYPTELPDLLRAAKLRKNLCNRKYDEVRE
jgi:hypothetical protein